MKTPEWLGLLRIVKPSFWDVGAYTLGLYCLGHHSGLF